MGLIVYFLFYLNGSYNLDILSGRIGEEYTSSLVDTGSNQEPRKVIKEITIARDEEAEPAGKGEIQATELKKMAMSFAERFGSYSNHSDFSNILDLKIFMTDGMQKWADSYVESSRMSKGDTSVFQGVITKAIMSEVKVYELENGKAQILVKTQKTSSDDNVSESVVSYEDILITFVKENEEWKVNEARWQQ